MAWQKDLYDAFEMQRGLCRGTAALDRLMVKRLTRRGATGLLVMTATALATPSARATEPMLVFDLASTPDAAPLLVIERDGTVLTRNATGGQTTSNSKLSTDARAALVSHLLQTLHLDDIDTGTIQSEIDRLSAETGRIMALADGSETRIALSTEDTDLQLAFYGTDWAARLFPEIEPLQRLEAGRLFLLDVYRDFN